MNIEEAIEKLSTFKLANRIEIISEEEFKDVKEAIETILTAYEKEKEEHKKECHNCDEYTARLGELETKNRMLKSELEKEKEKNKDILSDNIESFQKYFSEELYTKFMDKEKLRKIIYPSPENQIPIEIQQSEMYKKLLKELEE